MEFAIAKVSTKGQIVIPTSLRNGIYAGDEFLIIKDNDKMVMKNIKDLAESFKDDLLFAESIEKSWDDYGKGKFTTKSKDDFLKDLEEC